MRDIIWSDMVWNLKRSCVRSNIVIKSQLRQTRSALLSNVSFKNSILISFCDRDDLTCPASAVAWTGCSWWAPPHSWGPGPARPPRWPRHPPAPPSYLAQTWGVYCHTRGLQGKIVQRNMRLWDWESGLRSLRIVLSRYQLTVTMQLQGLVSGMDDGHKDCTLIINKTMKLNIKIDWKSHKNKFRI